MAMNCPVCGCSETSVTDSRPTKHSVKRRRKCLQCDFVWTTYETTVNTSDFNRIVSSARARLEKAIKDMGVIRDYLEGMDLETRDDEDEMESELLICSDKCR